MVVQKVKKVDLEGTYTRRITGKEFTVTKSDNLYRVVSADKGNIRFLNETELLNKFKEKK